MNRRSVLVIGAGGLVGSSLSPAFAARGWHVSATVRSPDAQARIGDALDDTSVVLVRDALDIREVRAAIEAARPEVVINCVATMPKSGDDAARAYVDGNVLAQTVTLDACLRAGVPRVIVFGSGFEYAPGPRPLSEHDALGPTTLYGATKQAGSVFAQYYRTMCGVEVSVARPFSLFGPRERLSRFVPYVVTSALSGQPITMSSGTQRRDYLFVDDLADGIVRLAESPSPMPAVVNFSGPAEHSLLDVVTAVVEIVGSNVSVINTRPGNTGDRPVFLGDSSLARAVLGWRPTHDLQDGLVKTVEWYRMNSKIWEPAV
jgi:nucleoside-diphosphate-sugar epimerase